MNLHIVGHSGFGDGLHQRAPVRKLIDAGYDIWLQTPSPCIYHDLVGDRLRLVCNNTRLRTQAKNITRERDRFTTDPVPKNARVLNVRYGRDTVLACGSVLAAMCHAFMVDGKDADFRMPVPQAWINKAPKHGDFILYRPPVARKEWGGAAPRNPDTDAYARIFAAIRGDREVVSVADLQDGHEWIVGTHPYCDTNYHRGELDFEQLAALTLQAAFVYTTPGVMTVLAQALGVPCITVFGGYESAMSFSGGAKFSPWLAIEPVAPCACWSHQHRCDKRIDVEAAIERAQRFLEIVSYEACIPAALDQVAATSDDAGRSRATIDRMGRLHEYVGANASAVGA